MNYLQVKKIQLKPDHFGNHIEITMIGLYDCSGKWIKWVKLDPVVISLIQQVKIETDINF